MGVHAAVDTRLLGKCAKRSSRTAHEERGVWKRAWTLDAGKLGTGVRHRQGVVVRCEPGCGDYFDRNVSESTVSLVTPNV